MKKYLFLFLLIPLSSLAQEVPCRWETSQRGDVFDGIKKEATIYSYCYREREVEDIDILNSRYTGRMITKGYSSSITITNYGDYYESINFSIEIKDEKNKKISVGSLYSVVKTWQELNKSLNEEPESSGFVNKVKDGVNRILNNENDNEIKKREPLKISIAFDNSPSVIYKINTTGYTLFNTGYVDLSPGCYGIRNCKYSVVKNDKIVGEITSLELINLMKVKSSIQIRVSTNALLSDIWHQNEYKASFSLRGSTKAIDYALQ